MDARGEGLRRDAGLKPPVIELDARLASAFRPRHVAVVGATEDRNRVGGRPLYYLRSFGFAGAVYPVNPKRDSIQGHKAYPSLEALPEAPDVAVVAVGGDHVSEVIRQCAARGVHSAVVMSSGFGETGPEGMRKQRELVAQARTLGVRLIGPNAQGIANFQTGAVLNFSMSTWKTARVGPFFASHSGRHAPARSPPPALIRSRPSPGPRRRPRRPSRAARRCRPRDGRPASAGCSRSSCC